MSDLISRSELIKVLKDRATNEAIMGYMTAYDVTNSIIDEVEEQPIAYDIGKVVKELEELDDKSITRYKNGNFGDFDGVEYYIKKREAIEIVKQGSVSDDECEWKKSKDYPFDWLVGCDGCEVNHKQGNYCPRCGKKIKVVE